MSVSMIPSSIPTYETGEIALNNLLLDLHSEIESLKYKNSELLFQLYVKYKCECQDSNLIAGPNVTDELKTIILDLDESRELRQRYEEECKKNAQLVKEIENLKKMHIISSDEANSLTKVPIKSSLKLTPTATRKSMQNFPKIQVKKKVQIFEQKSKSDISTSKPFLSSKVTSDTNNSKIKFSMTNSIGSGISALQFTSRQQSSINAKPVLENSRIGPLRNTGKN